MSDRGDATLKSFILGTLVGAVAGLLLAPEEGEKIRKKLKREIVRGRRELERISKEVREKAEEISEEARKELDILSERKQEQRETTGTATRRKTSRKAAPASRPRRFKGVS